MAWCGPISWPRIWLTHDRPRHWPHDWPHDWHHDWSHGVSDRLHDWRHDWPHYWPLWCHPVTNLPKIDPGKSNDLPLNNSHVSSQATILRPDKTFHYNNFHFMINIYHLHHNLLFIMPPCASCCARILQNKCHSQSTFLDNPLFLFSNIIISKRSRYSCLCLKLFSVFECFYISVPV